MKLRHARNTLILLLLLSSGCSTVQVASTRPGDPLRVVAPPLGFNARKVEKSIDQFLISRTGRSGLTASFGNTSPYLFSNDTGKFHLVLYGKVGYQDDQAFTYDVALAVMGFLLNGQQDRAEAILNVLEKDFYLPKNGTYGLYNAYLVSSRVPLEDLGMGGDGDRMHAGPTLWVAIAALNHAKIARNTRYLEFVLDMVDWCRSELTYFRFPDGERGGISMGMGWGPDWNKIFSTEHNVDYFSVLQMLHEIYKESPQEVQIIFHLKNVEDTWIQDEMAHIGRWIREIGFDSEAYCFRAGYNELGLDNLHILDGTSWGLGGVGPENYAAWGIDLDKLIENTERHFGATYTLPTGEVLRGFDITDPDGYERAREPLFWFEGTGQQIIAYSELARYYARKGDDKRAHKYGERAVFYTQQMYKFSDYYKLRGALPYMAIRPETYSIVKTLKWEWEIPRGKDDIQWVGSMSSTMWFLYCCHNFFNPMKWNG